MVAVVILLGTMLAVINRDVIDAKKDKMVFQASEMWNFAYENFLQNKVSFKS